MFKSATLLAFAMLISAANLNADDIQLRDIALLDHVRLRAEPGAAANADFLRPTITFDHAQITLPCVSKDNVYQDLTDSLDTLLCMLKNYAADGRLANDELKRMAEYGYEIRIIVKAQPAGQFVNAEDLAPNKTDDSFSYSLSAAFDREQALSKQILSLSNLFKKSITDVG